MSGTPLQSVKAWNFTPVTPGFGNAYFHVWHLAKLLNHFNHLFLVRRFYFTTYMIVYIQFAEYVYHTHPSSPMFFGCSQRRSGSGLGSDLENLYFCCNCKGNL
jgi:hypothetical protein